MSTLRASLPQSDVEQLSEEMWPAGHGAGADAKSDDDDEDEDEDGGDIEKQIAKEMTSMKRPRKEQRFGMSLKQSRVLVLIAAVRVQLIARPIRNAVRSTFVVWGPCI